MKLNALVAAPAVAVLATALANAGSGLPAGWLQTGKATSCHAGVASVSGGPTPKVFSLSCDLGTASFSTAMQQIRADDYAGKRVRLSASVQGEALAQWGGLWMRADTASNRSVAFDNMQERPLKGSFAWREAQVVLDIPAEARVLSFGFLVNGAGELRATQFKLEVVPGTVAVTDIARADVDRRSPPLPSQALNMSPP